MGLRLVILVATVGVLLHGPLAGAQTAITSSGLETTVTPPPGGSGIFQITGGSRPGGGPNLFHSFGLFSVGPGDTAQFRNTTPATPTANILGRITGGEASRIFGAIDTLEFPGANLFLMNPSGFVFGPGAQLDIDGAFHAVTANYVSFGSPDGPRFHADAASEPPLTVADPSAFGFLGTPTGSISVLPGTGLSVPEGRTLSLVGAGVAVTGDPVTATTLNAPSGRIQIASVASAGKVGLGTPDTPALTVESFTRLGRIDISGGAVLSASDVSGLGGGSVVIRGAKLFVDGSQVVSNTVGFADGARVGIDLELRDELAVTHGSSVSTTSDFGASGRSGDVSISSASVQVDNSFVGTQSQSFFDGSAGNVFLDVGSLRVTGLGTVGSVSFGSGRPGDLTVRANSIAISGRDISLGFPISSQLLSETSGGDGGRVDVTASSLTMGEGGTITSRTFGFTRGADLVIDVDRLTMTGGAEISSLTGSLAAGGNVTVTARESANISGRFSDGSPTGIFAAGVVGGATGDIILNFGTLALGGGALIQSGNILDSQGGNVSVTADSIAISGASGIASQARDQDVGRVDITAQTLTMDNGFLRTSTLEKGRAGDMTVTVGTVTMTGGAQMVTSSELFASGAGGNITLTAGGPVSISGTSASGQASGLFSTTEGSGAGGKIDLSASRVVLADGATISAKSTGTGLAGNVTITAGTLQSQDSFVTTQARQADGGDVDIRVGSLVHLSGSEITTSVGQGEGKGGNITIDPQFVVLKNSQIRADAFGGPGGNITIVTDVFLSSDSILSASSALSAPGIINIQSQVSDVSGDLARLPEAVLQAAALLRASCAARLSEGKSSSLVVAGREGQPPEPGDFLPRPFVESKPALARVAPAQEVRWETLPPISLAVLDPKCLR